MQRVQTQLAFDARERRFKVPGHVFRTRFEVPKDGVHDAQLTAALLAAAARVERRPRVAEAAEVAEVSLDAAAETRATVARRLDENDLVGLVAAGRERLVLTVFPQATAAADSCDTQHTTQSSK